MNLGVIGVGYWGQKILEEYLNIAKEGKISITDICDVQYEILNLCKKKYDLTDITLWNDYNRMLSFSRIDAVHIATPNYTHYCIGKNAINAKKHVLLEKPLTLKSPKAFELVSLSKLNKIVLQVGHIYRFNNAIIKIKKLIEKGWFGDIYSMRLQWTTLMVSPKNRDIIFDLAPHPIDIVSFVLDKWPIKIYCLAKAFRRKKFKEEAFISLELPEDIICSIELSWLRPKKTRRMVIVGSKHSADVDCLNQKIYSFDTSKSHVNSIKPSAIYVERNNTIATELNHFIDRIRDGTRSTNSGDLGAKNVRILELIKQSSIEGKIIKVS